MYLTEIECEDINSKIDFMKAMEKAFKFPPYFGENWDALWDCITDMYWINDSEIKLILNNSQHLNSKLEFDIISFFQELKIHIEKNNTESEIKHFFNYELK